MLTLISVMTLSCRIHSCNDDGDDDDDDGDDDDDDDDDDDIYEYKGTTKNGDVLCAPFL